MPDGPASPSSDSADDRLSSSQRAALRQAERVAADCEETALGRIRQIFGRGGLTLDSYLAAVEQLRTHARVVVHFHPDRISCSGLTVAEGLLCDGVYRNQFETGLSTGSTTAYSGGLRDQWEHRLFSGAYHVAGVASAERPKYGALELVRYPDGPIPRFGSCYMVLRPEVSWRASFTFAGSEDARALERLGTIRAIHSVMAALFEEVESGGFAAPPWPPFRSPTLGIPHLTVSKLMSVLNALSGARPDPLASPGRVLDSQIEAQIHGELRLERDVELLVGDCSFEPTPAGDALRATAARYQVPLLWHGGFSLKAHDVPEDFRGPDMPVLARRIAAHDDTLTPAVIGTAEASLGRDRRSWAAGGSEEEVRLHLKQLWHVLVHHGRWGALAR